MQLRRKLTISFIATAVMTAAAVVSPSWQVEAQVVVPTRAEEVSVPLDRSGVVVLPFAAQHIAVHWRGEHDAAVQVAFSTDGVTFEPPHDVLHDEVGSARGDGETYGAVMAARGATHVRVTAGRPLPRVSVLALADGEAQVVERRVPSNQAGASTTIGGRVVVTRSAWGANEKLRSDRRGRVIWPADFHRVQKLVVHHTATEGSMTDPAAEIRAIYHYHAVTQGWGDIGYSFLVDGAGKIYEGRHSDDDPATPTSEDAQGRLVTAGHTYEHNVGNVGVAVLGTFTANPRVEPPPEAVAAVKDLLAWEVSRHHLPPALVAGETTDPRVTYTNVLNGIQKPISTVTGHGDVVATECPGLLHEHLVGLRNEVAASGPTVDGEAPSAPSGLTATGARRSVTLRWSAASDGDPALSSGIAGYEIERSADDGSTWARIAFSDDDTLGYTDTVARGRYRYRVTAFDAVNLRSGPAVSVPVSAA